MHVVFRESHGLEETETPTDLGQDPAELVVLSFSDSDLGAFSAGWHRARAAGGDMPDLRLANLAALKHPLSVDTYVEQTLAGARGILIRLIGGVPYWSYGLQQVAALAQEKALRWQCCQPMAGPIRGWTRSRPCPCQPFGVCSICAMQAVRSQRRARWHKWRLPPGYTLHPCAGPNMCLSSAAGRPTMA